jgi:hypothetical protein
MKSLIVAITIGLNGPAAPQDSPSSFNDNCTYVLVAPDIVPNGGRFSVRANGFPEDEAKKWNQATRVREMFAPQSEQQKGFVYAAKQPNQSVGTLFRYSALIAVRSPARNASDFAPSVELPRSKFSVLEWEPKTIFKRPPRRVSRSITESEAESLAKKHGWTFPPCK